MNVISWNKIFRRFDFNKAMTTDNHKAFPIFFL